MASCPGFKFVSPRQPLSKIQQIRSKINWDTKSDQHNKLIPLTVICNHVECDYSAEYRYAIAWHVQNGSISKNLLKTLFERLITTYRKIKHEKLITVNCKNSKCVGFKLRVQNADKSDGSLVQPNVHAHPKTFEPLITKCDGNCDLAVDIKWVFYYLVVTDCIDEEVLKSINENGWVAKTSTFHCNRERINLFIKELGRPINHSDWLWHPSESLGLVNFLIWEKRGKSF